MANKSEVDSTIHKYFSSLDKSAQIAHSSKSFKTPHILQCFTELRALSIEEDKFLAPSLFSPNRNKDRRLAVFGPTPGKI